MKRYREIELIAYDLAQSLSAYAGSYRGSPYKIKSDEILTEYLDYKSHRDGLKNQVVTDWDHLESKIVGLLHDDNKELSELREKAEEIVETVKCLLSSGKLHSDDSKVGSKRMIPAAAVLEFLYLAKLLGCQPTVDLDKGKFTIRYISIEGVGLGNIVIDRETSTEVKISDSAARELYTDLNLMREAYKREEDEKERQEILSRLSEREKRLLGLL